LSVVDADVVVAGLGGWRLIGVRLVLVDDVLAIIGRDPRKVAPKMCEVNIWLDKVQASRRLFAKHIMAASFWALWKTRNKACFDNVLPADPCELIYVTCQYIDYWRNLQKPGTRKALARGIKELKIMIQQVFT
jgi:hypothetical protein